MPQPNEQPELIIPFGQIPMLPMFGPLALLVIVSVWVDPTQWKTGPAWAYVLLIGAPSLAIIGNIILPRVSYLQLTSAGLLIKYPFGHSFYAWAEVQDFKVIDGPSVGISSSGPRIAFDFAKDSPRRNLAIKMGAAVLGSDLRFMAAYRIHPDELAHTLNEWQQRYGSHR